MEEYKKVTISFTKRALKDSREKTGSRQKEGADGYATDEDEYFGLYM